MFKYDINLDFKPLLGFYNIDEIFSVSIKNSIKEIYSDNINFLDITPEIFQKQKMRRRKEKDLDEFGIISLNWIEKMQKFLPGVIVQMIDITDSVNVTEIDMAKIYEPIKKEILKINMNYQQTHQFIIIKNLNKVYGLEDSIKTKIVSKYNFIKEKCLYFINDTNHIINPEINKKIAHIIRDELNKFYSSKIQKYKKFISQEKNEEKEFVIKNLLKISFLSKIINITTLQSSIINNDSIQKAYDILSLELNKSSYIFCQPNIKIIYLELKNVADFLIYQKLIQNNLSLNDIIRIINNHLNNFDFFNFYRNTKTDINKVINIFRKMKDIYFINMLWKHSWYLFLLENYKEINLFEIENISLKGYIMDNLLHLYYFLLNEPEFIKEISKQFNNEVSYRKMKNNYLEKIPKFYEVDGECITGKLSDEENLGLYIAELIFENSNLITTQSILQILENIIINSKTNYYDFFLINKYYLNNTNEEGSENKNDVDINKILGILLHKNNKYLLKFPNIYSHISTKFNNFILNNKFENKDENITDLFKMIEYLILYASISENDLTNEESNKINELLTYNINTQNNTIQLNSFENNLFNIEITYNLKEVKPLDFITTNINISLVRKDIILNIDKIVVHFPKSYKKEKDKYSKEIAINKELSKDNPISFSFNNLVKFFFNNLYVIHIELYLKNKVIINLINKEKRHIVFYDKSKNLISEKDIIDVNINTKKTISSSKDSQADKLSQKYLSVGKNENHILCINYKTKIDNDDVYIKHTKATIKLVKEYSKLGEETKCFQFKIINEQGYLNYGNKQLILDYYNINLEKNPPSLEFVLQIGETGKFKLDYQINFTLINKNCPDDYSIMNFNDSTQIQCIEPFKYSNEVNSSLYYINYYINKENKQNLLKIYSINYPIYINSFLQNELPEKIIIKKIVFIPSNNSININSPIEKLFSKNQNYKISFSQNEKISINSKMISKENLNGPIGKIQISWSSENLHNHKYFNESMLNETVFDLNEINITQLPVSIEGRYNDKVNRYQLKIKNLESMTKIIKFSLKEINGNPKKENFILLGKTDISEILLPLKEINLQYNIYDKITGSNFMDVNENINYRFNNLITLNEYYILDAKDKFDLKALRNTIFYSPEIFKISN